MPYATKAIINHEFVIDHLDIYVEFRHPMDINIKPPNDLWIVVCDDAPKVIVASSWLDHWTLLLTTETIAIEPNYVTVAYAGPNPLLKTVWDKQWNEWGAIPSYSGWPTTFKRGMIILWHGAVSTIPAGWHLCDGGEDTPDLRDRFLIGAGNAYAPGDTGGETTHQHTITNQVTGGSSNWVSKSGGLQFASDPNHTHTLNGTTDNKNTLPPYYALCYIMKL